MNAHEKQQLKALYVATSLYYGYDLPDEALKLYVEDLNDLPYQDVARAIGEIRRDPKNNRCPLPATIRAKLQPIIDPELEADHLVGLVVQAISRVGPYRIPELPPVAMELIKLEGGWENICSMVTDSNLATFKAQWRRLATVLLKKQTSSSNAIAIEGKPPIDINKFLPEFPKEPK